MKLLKSDLLPAVQFLGQIASKRTTLPVLHCFLLEASSGSLSVRACDFDQDATCVIPCKQDLAPVLVNARHLSELAKSASESLSISAINGGGKIEVASDWNAVVPVLKAEEFPTKTLSAGTAQGVLTADLVAGIRAVLWGAATADDDRFDQNRIILTGVHIVSTGKQIVCEGTNGGEMGRYAVASIAGKFEFVLPAQFAGAFIWALEKPGSNLFLGENSATVKYDGGEYSAKLLEGKYHSTKLIIEADRVELGELDISAAIAHLKNCLLLSDEQWLVARLSFGADGLKIASVPSKGESSYSATIPGKFTSEEFETNAKPLLAMMKSVPVEKAKVLMSANRQLVIESGNYTALITAKRVK